MSPMPTPRVDAGPPGGDQAWQVPAFDVLRWTGASRPFCVVIPVINEGERIGRLLHRMAALDVAALADIIVVDGGSTDGSLADGMLSNCGVRGLLRKTGPGRLSAQLRCAYAFALQHGYRGIITIDGNDKDDPDTIPAFIEALEQGVDFVQGSRFIAGGVGEHTPRTREWAIRLIHAPALSLASGFRWTDTTQGYRAYSARLLRDPRVAPFRDVFERYELLAYLSYRAPRLGFRCLELPTARRYPADGKVPTKISGFRGNIELLAVLARACRGRYDP
jgi:dolichol-phosphate mannosyltransferase